MGAYAIAPTRVHEKPVRFHISAHGYAKNAPDFTLPNRDTPKTRQILAPNLRRGSFRGVCFCAPTRVRAKFGGFHISTHVPTKHIPDFTLPNRDTPKTCPILGANRRRGTFRGVCFCAPTRVHGKPGRFHISQQGYTQIPPGFRREPLSRIISGRMQYAPTRVRAKPARFYTQTFGERHLRGVYNRRPTWVREKLGGF